MAPKSSSTSASSKATSSPTSKAATPPPSKAASSKPPTPTPKQTSDILTTASETEYKQELSAPEAKAKAALEKGISFSHAL